MVDDRKFPREMGTLARTVDPPYNKLTPPTVHKQKLAQDDAMTSHFCYFLILAASVCVLHLRTNTIPYCA